MARSKVAEKPTATPVSYGNTITLSSGVVLQLRRVGYWIVYEASRRLKRPKVPVQFIDDKGREEENPAHPDYVQAMQDYNDRMTEVILNANIWFGTRLISKPVDMLGPEDAWGEEFAFLGIEVPESKQDRYAQWVKLVACGGSAAEFTKITQAIGQLNSVAEEDVTAAAESFRSDA